jgi:hypothetical protein
MGFQSAFKGLKNTKFHFTGSQASAAMWTELSFLGFYATQNGRFLTDVSANMSDPSSSVKILTHEHGTDRLSRNVGIELPLCAA